MRLRTKVRTNLEPMKKKYSASGMRAVGNKLGEQVVTDMFNFVPKGQTKRLSKGKWNPGRRVAEYNTPYARAQFYGIGRGGRRFRKYTTPGTGPRWDLKAKSRYSRQWAKQVGRNLGG